jgi:hypothetical protein
MRIISRIILLCVFIIGIASKGSTQNRANIWKLGYSVQVNIHPNIDFQSGIADTFGDLRRFGFFLTDASICDTTGNLRFYTNGYYIVNDSNKTLKNFEGFNPGFATNFYGGNGLGIEQGVIIFPSPTNNYEYYLFNSSGEQIVYKGVPDVQPLTLRYSIINMKLDKGKGGIDSAFKALIALSDTLTLGRITACKHANGKD